MVDQDDDDVHVKLLGPAKVHFQPAPCSNSTVLSAVMSKDTIDLDADAAGIHGKFLVHLQHAMVLLLEMHIQYVTCDM